MSRAFGTRFSHALGVWKLLTNIPRSTPAGDIGVDTSF